MKYLDISSMFSLPFNNVRNNPVALSSLLAFKYAYVIVCFVFK